MFQQGQRVVCVDDDFAPWVFDFFKQLPKKGQHYTIRSVGMGASNPNWNVSDEGISRGETEPDFNVLVEELQNPDDPTCSFKQELSFKAERFAPLEEVPPEENEAYAGRELVEAR